LRIREVPAVRRAAAILNLLANNTSGLNASHIARELGIVQSTCLHILRELAGAHLVTKDRSNKTYQLGLGVLSLAKGLSSHDSFITNAQQRIDYGVSANAQQREGDDVIVVTAAAASEGLVAPVGRRSPVLSGSGGQLLGAHAGWSDDELQVRFAQVNWQNPPDFKTWREDASRAQQRGYAIDDGRQRLGITSMSVAVADRFGKVIRTLSINMVSAQIDPARREVLIKALQDASADVARAL
jgi:DNA-binding IclR family transcriptional regulator